MKASSPAAADLLNLGAFLALDNIPYELLLLGKAHLGELLSAALVDVLARGCDQLSAERSYSKGFSP